MNSLKGEKTTQQTHVSTFLSLSLSLPSPLIHPARPGEWCDVEYSTAINKTGLLSYQHADFLVVVHFKPDS